MTNAYPLTEFVQDFGDSLLAAVRDQNPPVFDDTHNAEWDGVLDQFLRRPFDAQRERVQAAAKLLLDQNERAVIINGEMGCGKSMMGICAAEILRHAGYRRTLVICPPHLVYKWRREILVTVPDARVWILNGPDTLVKLLKLRELFGAAEGPEYFVMGRVRMRMGFNWQPAVNTRVMASTRDDGSVHAWRAASCPSCGEYVLDEDGEPLPPAAVRGDKRTACTGCGERLWSLTRPNQKAFDLKQALHKSLCRLPTIGPKTADKLIDTFGHRQLVQMLDDNLYEFINLMDQDGELVFSDRQAQRFERSMANVEFSFGQGGYQPTEFIKRYLPCGFFGSLLVDEGHEYKNAGTAQGQAMGVLSMQCSKVILLTGTLMGGYADDLFHLLWRLMPRRMIEDGFRYNARGSIGPAVLAFMREHGVLKDIYTEREDTHHRTARGSKVTVHTTKAPGFGPMGIMRFVLPFTVFLRLKDLGEGILPLFEEELVSVDMTAQQAESYRTLSSVLTAEMRSALAKGDTTLLGVVLNALLAWPECCFREEHVRHPRTRETLALVPPHFDDATATPKEEKLIEICRREKALGRRVLVYTTYTGRRDTSTRLQKLLSVADLKVAVLRASIATERREDWILDQVDRGIDVLICNPELVKTGLDLLEFTTIVFMQAGYNVYTLQQASRRSWRIGQTEVVKVIYLGYVDTAQESALRLMAQKIQVSQSTSGEMPETGLDILNTDGDSIEVALAKELLKAA